MYMLSLEQKAERLQTIKEVAERMKRRKEFKAKQQANAIRVRRYTDEVEKPKRKKAQDSFDAEIARMDENYNAWTDASKYAKEYYGDCMYETTRFDNDWD